jgi:hypothetical protein
LEILIQAVAAAEAIMAMEQLKLQAVEVGVTAVQVVEDNPKAMPGIMAEAEVLADLRAATLIMVEMDIRE